MRVFSTILTTLTLAAHLIGGCCWHHAHAACASAACTHSHHDDSQHDDPHDSCPPSEPCEGACVVILDRKANVEHSPLTDVDLAPVLLFESPRPTPAPLVVVRTPRDQHPPSLRIHLRNGVLLI